jgi:anion-transporting  ArsA/GET3 family ATPase
MENWCYEPEALALFATHYQTGEIIPIELVQKIKESSNFQEGMATMSVEFWLTTWDGMDKILRLLQILKLLKSNNLQTLNYILR